MGDPLFAVRTHFYLGAFQSAVSAGSQLTGLTDAQRLERDVLVLRAYVELGSHDLVLSEVPEGAPPPLGAVRRLAARARDPDGERAASLADAEAWAASPDPTARAVAGIILAAEGRPEDALRACHAGPGLEAMALATQVLLGMDRPDAAERQAKRLAEADDDAPLTALAAAWVGAALGGARAQEAYYALQELGDKHGWTPRLHAALAAVQMRMGRWEDAEAELMQAFEKAPKDGDVLANLAAVQLHLGKPAGRYLGLLKAAAPGHAALARAEAAAAAFDRAAEQVAAA